MYVDYTSVAHSTLAISGRASKVPSTGAKPTIAAPVVAMRPPLPRGTYDAAAISAHFATPEGASALRERSLFVASRLGTGFWKSSSIEALGPTFVKFGQALANRPDLIGPAFADELRLLQDSCAPFSRDEAIRIIREDLPEERASEVLAALPEAPAAAASLGQVYRLSLPSMRDPIALKVLRPDVREMVAMDACIARSAAGWLESLRWPPIGAGGSRLLKPAIVAGVDEFFSRLFEEMDFDNEMKNIERFGSLYRRNRPAGRALARAARRRRDTAAELVVPLAEPRWSGSRVLAMTWIEGEPLLRRGASSLPTSELPLVRFGIDATLSQMLEEGVMHADPHGGNLLRAPPRVPSLPSRIVRTVLRRPSPPPRLAYIDFGLVSDVPTSVRDGLVCAVAQLLFARDYAAVVRLFDELMLLPPAELDSADTRVELQAALEQVADRVLQMPAAPTADGDGGSSGASSDAPLASTPTALPTLEFGALLAQLALIAPRFSLQLPPYFLNNARGLATLEGMAKSADPSFDVLQAVYPFALRRLLADPSNSPLLRSTLRELTRDANGRLDLERVRRLIDDAARLSGRPRRKLIAEAARTPGGRALGRDVALATAAGAWRRATR